MVSPLTRGSLGFILDDKQIEVKTAQPRSQRDQERHVATTPSGTFNNSQATTTNTAPMGSSMPFMSMNNTGAGGDMSMMYQRMMNGMGTPYGAMMGGGMGMMGGFNPMMGMGMGRFCMGGMGGAINPMATAGNMGMGGGVGGMRLKMRPIGMTSTGAGIGMVAAGGAAGMGAGAAAAAAAAAGMGTGTGMRQGMGMGMMGAG